MMTMGENEIDDTDVDKEIQNITLSLQGGGNGG